MNNVDMDDDVAPNRTYIARLHKQQLTRQHKINCGYCKYHRGENRTHKSPHADTKKLHVKWKVRS